MGVLDFLSRITSGNNTIDDLIRVARSDPNRRYDVLVQLKKMNDPKTNDIFCSMLYDPSPRIRNLSITALSEIGDETALYYLSELVRTQDFSNDGKRTNFGHSENITLAQEAIANVRKRVTVNNLHSSRPVNKPSHYQKMIDDGIRLLSEGRASEAINIFNKILSEYPNDNQAFRWRSRAKERLTANTPVNSYPTSNSATQTPVPPTVNYPANPPKSQLPSYQTMMNRGIKLISEGRPSEAIDIFNKILSEYPNDNQAFRWRSLAKERLTPTSQKSNNPIPPPKRSVQKSDDSQLYPSAYHNSNREATDRLKLVIRDHGTKILDTPQIFQGLLKDYYRGEFKKETRVLLTCLEERIPADLIGKKGNIPFSTQSDQLIRRLEDNGFSKDLSRWAVYSWAEVFEIKKTD